MDFRASKKIVIDASRGGEDIGVTSGTLKEKDYNLEISKYIYNKLKSLGVDVALTRDNDETLDVNSRVNKIKSLYGTGQDVIVISNTLSSNGTGAEIIYALRNNNTLASSIAKEIEKQGQEVNKYYQRRLPTDTSKDYNQLIRDTANNETLIISYGNVNNSQELNNLLNNQTLLADAVITSLANYLGLNYTPSQKEGYYTVKSGDSLYSIAQKYSTTVSELKQLNNLPSNLLSIGQVLRLPTTTTPTNKTYTVKSGDSLYSIAKAYNTTVSELKQLNNLTSNLLSIGQVLRLPTTTTTPTNKTYTVKSGDSLYSIAKAYNTTVSELKQLNNLTSNLLSIGQVLRLPTTTTTPTNKTYTVKSGDSLYSIAKAYNTTVSELKQLNNLTSNLLSIGQVLKISS